MTDLLTFCKVRRKCRKNYNCIDSRRTAQKTSVSDSSLFSLRIVECMLLALVWHYAFSSGPSAILIRPFLPIKS